MTIAVAAFLVAWLSGLHWMLTQLLWLLAAGCMACNSIAFVRFSFEQADLKARRKPPAGPILFDAAVYFAFGAVAFMWS